GEDRRSYTDVGTRIKEPVRALYNTVFLLFWDMTRLNLDALNMVRLLESVSAIFFCVQCITEENRRQSNFCGRRAAHQTAAAAGGNIDTALD
ncbi:MAG: hypothetical protein IKB82_02400, partial [Clostridia bacterium]|nr:hypothetical protein [Clostridia bacterium]